MKVAVVGSGGREHALLWKLAQDKRINALFALPGNAGTEILARTVPVQPDNVEELHQQLLALRPDLVVVGPEIPLQAGIADRLKRDNIACFGPTAQAARIETSKVFAKRLMARNGVPTAEFQIFDSFPVLREYVADQPFGSGWVVKADGLAAGKGAFVCSSAAEVLQYAHELLTDGILGAAGHRVVLERRLTGRETSALFWCDGQHFVPLPAAQDFKRAGDGDTGQNTGGMGSVCPAPQMTPKLLDQVANEIIRPIVDALAAEGSPFCGILYAGLMLTDYGPQVIEFNCRFGDPETQVILPAWDGSILDAILACVNGSLCSASIPSDAHRSAVSVVLAAEGYPGNYARGIRLHTMPDTKECLTFHSGTKQTDARLVSSGGRVLNAVGIGNTVDDARERAYQLAEKLAVPGLFYRKDIAAAREYATR